MKPLRIAVVGTGHLGRIHARILSTLPQVELVGVVDPVPAARVEVASQYGVRAFAHHGELCGLVDAVVLAAPTSQHHAIGLELLRDRLHLLVEKPLASDATQAQDLVDAAAKQGVVLQVGHVERFNPALSAALPYVRDPKYISATRAGAFSFRSLDIGVVMDLMIHDIDLVLSLVRSRVQGVSALGLSVFGGHEDLATARLMFDNGCVAVLHASRASYEAVRSMQVWSFRGMATIDLGNRQATLVRPSEMLMRREFDATQLSRDEAAQLKDRVFEQLLTRETLQVEPVDQITAELEDFVDSIRTLREPRVSGAKAAPLSKWPNECCWPSSVMPGMARSTVATGRLPLLPLPFFAVLTGRNNPKSRLYSAKRPASSRLSRLAEARRRGWVVPAQFCESRSAWRPAPLERREGLVPPAPWAIQARFPASL